MAHLPSLLPFLSFLLLLPHSLSRLISPQSTVTSLDVAASLHKTTAALSFHTQNFDQIAASAAAGEPAATATLSLKLHSRDFLPIPNATIHKDYRSLLLSRLRRDAARADAIAARVALAGVSKSDLKPLENELVTAVAGGTAALKGPIVSGTSEGSGEYFSRVGIGRPAKPAFLVLDTGSDVSWVQCEPCTDCYSQSDPIFDPAASSTYSQLRCDSPSCKALEISACRNSSCLYQVSYGDGSYTVGDFATETLTFGDQSVNGIALGCGHDNEGLFVGAAGLLGLGGGALAFPSQISAKSFSYCLVDRDSPAESTIDFGENLVDAASMVTAPLLRNSKLDTFYYVSMSGISVGGEMLAIPPSLFAMDVSGGGGVIVDSGTAVTRLQTAAYEAMRDAFAKGAADLAKASGVALFDTCYDLSAKTSVEVPTVGFHFAGGKELRLPAKNYLIPVDSTGTFCFAFAPTASPLSIIGNVQQQGIRVAFDVENSVVGFGANKC